MQISPELIPHDQFHKGIWLQAMERPVWYYFMPKKNTNRISNKKFIKTVDGPLRNLVRFLHRKRIRTTPSCAGHHIGEKNFEKIYSALEKDRDAIRSEGLEFKDVESGRKYFFKNPEYELPWTKEEFINKIINYQQKGVIGLRLEKKKLKKKLLRIAIEGVEVKEKDSIIFIFTNEDKLGDNAHTWSEITKRIKQIFSSSGIKKLNRKDDSEMASAA